MCGIVGIVGLTRPVDVAALQRMNDRQRHRGPDGEGFLLAWPNGGGNRFRHAFLPHTNRWDAATPVTVGLGHRRLAILDLSDRGLQPLTVGDSDVWIVFNGEIYNHQELRAELETLGHCFTTRTDTEVLLQAYRRWGEDCLGRLDGMFAFAVWDGPRGRLFCARDRLGIKPFYYATPPGAFIFASEIKALLAYPGLAAQPDDEAVVGFLVHANCDYGERTLLAAVKALAPAHALTLDAATGRFAPRAYWRLEPAAQNGAGDATRIDGLRDLLLATTRRHLISDVPVGSCLSGGLDSSTVVSLIGKIWREQPDAAQALGDCFNTFTACYEQREVDEREYALAVAHSVGANPHLVFPAPDDFLETFARMAWHQDMPFGEMTYYAQWRVMRAAKDAGVKVLLDGQGGDEVFGGYAKFRYAYLASLLRSGRWIGLAKEFGATVLQGDRYVLNIRNGYRYLPRQVAVSVPDVQHVAIALQHGRTELLRQPDPPTRPEQRGEIGVAELGVAAEHLVASLAVQQHLHTRVLRGPHHAPLRVVGHLAERHVLMPRHAREGLQEVVGRGKHQVRVGADRVRHRQRVLPLVDLPLLVARGERVEAVPQGLGRVRLLAPDLPDQ